ncbi:saxitoxin and tetrodotoxin-binding protein 2-like protein [Lates japonicus]|uniref:Saxitoxin and tetrodotoxin-binding protein 2-like protein n=1 Tax=Lates japonicus TaxID=270547 RepID=A0AAD3ND58_LATJO|nr:saxitoxin and tetrodotoxin-binding protein 2-like protein [Lates japonicus]
MCDKSLLNYVINMSMPSDPSDSGRQAHTLPTSATVERDGVVQPYSDSGVVDVYEAAYDCLVVIYKNISRTICSSTHRAGVFDFVSEQDDLCCGRAVLLLLLVEVIGSRPSPKPRGCEGLNKPLPRNDLHKRFLGTGFWSGLSLTMRMAGKWAKINSSTSSSAPPDNKTISFIERNLHVEPSTQPIPTELQEGGHHLDAEQLKSDLQSSQKRASVWDSSVAVRL